MSIDGEERWSPQTLADSYQRRGLMRVLAQALQLLGLPYIDRDLRLLKVHLLFQK